MQQHTKNGAEVEKQPCEICLSNAAVHSPAQLQFNDYNNGFISDEAKNGQASFLKANSHLCTVRRDGYIPLNQRGVHEMHPHHSAGLIKE